MAKEIERKFLVAGEAWRRGVIRSRRLRQAYLATTQRASVRVRIVDGEKAAIAVKSAEAGLVRAEFEYSVPVADAEAMFSLRSGEAVEKVRHEIPCAGGVLTVDEFSGANDGLVIAEIEMESERAVPDLPEWLGPEITHDRRYYNASLAARPFRTWPVEDRALAV